MSGVQGVGQDTPQAGWTSYGSLGSYSLSVRSVLRPPSIQCNDAAVQLPQAGSCNDAALPPDAVTDSSGAGFTLSPPGPYQPGRTSISVTPKDGSQACVVVLDVLPCPPIECNVVQKQLSYGLCDGADVSSTELWTGGPVGTIVFIFPKGPFGPGVSKVIVTPKSPIGLLECEATVAVVPCTPGCVADLSFAVPLDTCAISDAPTGLLEFTLSAIWCPQCRRRYPQRRPSAWALGRPRPR
jgi:hypothetical protein